jgi:CubicO group peptidase (beta-lactamase class C family)
MRKILIAFLLSGSLSSFAQSWQDTVQKIEKMFESYQGIPGAQLAISRNGQVIFSKAWGMADLEHDVTLTTYSLSEAGSVSKQFTAACMLLLEQQGKLSMEDDVRKYLPELPDYGTPVKLRQMMQHTSGLRDWGAIASMTGWPRSTKTYDNNDALLIVSRQKALNNIPGAEYIYSNSNYNLFAVIIERVSGLSLAEFSRKYIFEPAGMKQTQWRDDYRRVVKNRAIAYDPLDKGYRANMPNEFVYGNGGLLTTAEELLQWNHYYLGGKLGNPSLLEKQLYAYPFNNGNKNNYAAGLIIQTTNGWKDITHNGATAGYRADLHCFPELGLSISWLSNNSRSTDIVFSVINLFVPKKQQEPVAAPVSFNVAAQTLASYAGWYRNERNGEGLQLSSKDGFLMVQNQKLLPTSNTHFISGRNAIDFTGKGLHVINSSNDTIVFSSVPAADLSPQDIQQYAGTYRSEETESGLSVVVKEDKLSVKIKPTMEFVLTPTYKDGFTSPGGTIYFERDKRGKITAMKISVGRARNVVFKKMG